MIVILIVILIAAALFPPRTNPYEAERNNTHLSQTFLIISDFHLYAFHSYECHEYISGPRTVPVRSALIQAIALGSTLDRLAVDAAEDGGPSAVRKLLMGRPVMTYYELL